MDPRQKPIVILMGVGDNDAQEIRIASVLEATNVRKVDLVRVRGTQGHTQVEENASAGTLKLDAVAADLLCAAMDADAH